MSKRRKLPELGAIFLVPLRDGGFGIGVLARADGKGSAFGYFFGPRVSGPEEVQTDRLAPELALLVGMFGDPEILRGNWPLIGEMEHRGLDSWPLPPLSRVDENAGRAWLSTYSDTLQCLSEKEIDLVEASEYPYDRLMGAGAVEIRLTKLIKEAEAGRENQKAKR